TPFTREEAQTLRDVSGRLGFHVLYAPFETAAPVVSPAVDAVEGTLPSDYARLILTPDRAAFYDAYPQDIRPTTDDRPFYFHTTKLKDQLHVAFGRTMLFGNGLSALLTLLGISVALVVLFIVGPLAIAGGTRPSGWFGWLVYFGALGAGFMLIEVSVLQRFVLLLGHPVYSLTVTLFSLLLGTGIGAAWSRRLRESTLRRSTAISIVIVAAAVILVILIATPLVSWAIPFPRDVRIAIAVAALVPLGVALGVPMPAGIRLLSARAPQMVTWAWGINGALSVLGATLAIFIAMNWGFRVTLLSASGTYLVGLGAFLVATHPRG
ncbi:MAG TPA: hypothetical protein VHU82_07305, partial [Vicinamibacterales bacterium]|nr:hypothetical protein [Vicinamibacterales bacterium]